MKIRKIPGYSGFYKIAEDGRVWSCRVGGQRGVKGVWREMRVSLGNHGYPCLRLTRKGRSSMRLLHRLLLETFVGPCPKGMECLHKDGDKLNINLSNLIWGSKEENESDKDQHQTSNVGERNGISKLTEYDVQSIRKRRKKGERVRRLAVEFCVAPSTISAVVNRRIWKHVV